MGLELYELEFPLNYTLQIVLEKDSGTQDQSSSY